MINLLFLGDVVGQPGRKAVISQLPLLKKEFEVDFAIVNGENSAGGRGISPKIAIDLLRAGATVITTGDHVWDQKDLMDFMPTEPRVLRPLNYPEGTVGQGSVVLETKKGKIGVINAQGRTFIQPPLENPFLLVEAEAKRLKEEEGAIAIFVDFHAEATSEKIAMGRHLDGLVSAVVGTHTHVQTSDERVFPGGTAYLTDAGMCGPDDSILGCEIEPILSRFKTSLPVRFNVASGPARLGGVVIQIDEETGKAVSIERINRLIEADL